MNRVFNLTIAAVLTILAVACGSVPVANPLEPTVLSQTDVLAQQLPGPAPGLLSESTHGLQLSALIGTGSGIVNVTPTAAVEGSFSAQIEVNVHDAPPNTTFYVQRAPEIGRPNGSDGTCQRAEGLPPWGPPTPNFVTFAVGGSPVVFQTSPGGSGSVHINFAAPTIGDGTQFDVMFRLVDNLTSPSNELRTACFTVTVN